MRRWESVALVLILLLAASLRLSALGVVEFKRDEANLSQLALDLAHGRSVPLLGISSSVGIPNSPVSVYLFAIPYLFSSDPTVATGYVGILNIVAVFLTYAIARHYYGIVPALTAAVVYAVSPWAIIYSRKIWAQDILPPFVVATIGAGLLGLVEGKRWAQWVLLPVLCVTAQIHYSGMLLAVPVIYLLWVRRQRWTRSLYLSLIPTALLCLPFAVGILQADLPDVDQLAAISAESDTGRRVILSGDMLHYAALTIAGTEIHSLAGPEAYHDYLTSVPDVYALFGLLAWAVALSMLWLLWRSWRKSDARSLVDQVMLIWLVTPIVVFSVTWTTPYPHYLILMMPAAFIGFGAAAGALWERYSEKGIVRFVLFLMGGLTAIILGLQVILWISLVNFLRVTHTPDGFGTPLEYLMPVREAVLSSDAHNVLAHLDGQFVGFDDDATVWNTLLYAVGSVRFLDENVLVQPAEVSLQLSQGCEEDVNGRVFRLRSAAEGCYRLTDHAAQIPVTTAFQSIADKPLFANGVRLVAYSLEQFCFLLQWEITATTNEDYTFSVHFFNADGQETIIADGLSWRGVYWRAGDVVIRRFCLSSEQRVNWDEIVGVNLGMYIYDGLNFQNVDVLDGAGNPVGQYVTIEFGS